MRIRYGKTKKGLWLTVHDQSGEPLVSLVEYRHDYVEFIDAIKYYGDDEQLLEFECFVGNC